MPWSRKSLVMLALCCLTAAPAAWGQAAPSVAGDAQVWRARILHMATPTTASESPVVVVRAPISDYWIEIAAGTVAVAATALSIHYKFKADDHYDSYLETGNPALQPIYEAYDRRALIALGVGQVGFGVLAVRLALR